MFGLFSLPKLLFTVFMIVVVWQGFKWLSRRSELQSRRTEKVMSNMERNFEQANCEEMIKCADCGAFVPRDGGHRCC